MEESGALDWEVESDAWILHTVDCKVWETELRERERSLGLKIVQMIKKKKKRVKRCLESFNQTHHLLSLEPKLDFDRFWGTTLQSRSPRLTFTPPPNTFSWISQVKTFNCPIPKLDPHAFNTLLIIRLRPSGGILYKSVRHFKGSLWSQMNRWAHVLL